MTVPTQETDCAQHISIRNVLRTLGIPAHRKGFRQLSIAITIFAQDDTQSITKELYPATAKLTGIDDWRLVERDIRTAIQYAWTNRDPSIWDIYFPTLSKAPSNKVFITAMVEMLQ